MLAEASRASAKRKTVMIIAHQDEGALLSFNFSGIRAFSNTALQTLQQSGLKGNSKGFGLEVFLNELFLKGRIISKHIFRTGLPYRTQDMQERQRKEILITLKALRRRRQYRLLLRRR